MRVHEATPLHPARGAHGVWLLMEAVLESGIQTLRRCAGQHTALERKLYAEVMSWIYSGDRDLMSFENVCAVLCLDSNAMRYQFRRHGLIRPYSTATLGEKVKDRERICMARETCAVCKQQRKAVSRTSAGAPICRFCNEPSGSKLADRYGECRSCGKGPRDLVKSTYTGVLSCGSCRKHAARQQEAPQKERRLVGK
jgi:ribosomal protein L37AE/L43A